MAEIGKLGGLKCLANNSNKWKNRGVITKSNYQLNPNFCLQCKQIIEYPKRQNKFCNHTCSAKFNNTLRQKKIEFPKPETPFELLSHNTQKARLIKEHGHKCWDCQFEFWKDGPIPLQFGQFI